MLWICEGGGEIGFEFLAKDVEGLRGGGKTVLFEKGEGITRFA